jgi:RNA polymerase sigma-70 factor (sigma-E family)
MTRRRRWAASTGEDELLSGLYQQVTERQAPGFAAGYDMAAGLDRYRVWLAEHAAEEPSRPEAVPVQGSTTLRAAFADASAGAAAAVIGGPVALRRTTQGSTGSGTPAAGADWDAAQAVTTLYRTHYRSLVRLAVLLVRDVAAAEEIVQDSFIAMHAAWRRLRDDEKALSYLRQSVVNRSRSVLRHRTEVDKNAPKPPPEMPSAEQGAISLLERSAVIAALRTLPPKQREALVLKYYADLSEGQIAAAMGISRGAVKSHTARGVATLRAALELELRGGDRDAGTGWRR